MILMGTYVDIITGEILGYKLGGNCVYTAPVTAEKLKDLDVEDKEIVQYLDLEKIECIKGRGTTYAVLSNEMYFIDDFADVPYERLDGKVALYGHVFNDNAVCNFDSDLAIKRIQEAEKLGVESDESL